MPAPGSLNDFAVMVGLREVDTDLNGVTLAYDRPYAIELIELEKKYTHAKNHFPKKNFCLTCKQEVHTTLEVP